LESLCDNKPVKKTLAPFAYGRQRWLNKPIQARNLQAWLIDNGSLTRRLQQRYEDFSLQAVSVSVAKPNVDEQFCLCLSRRQSAWIRDVVLLGAGNGVVFAHSVIPIHTLRGAWSGLGKLGNQPLGALLFANPCVQRTPLQFKKLTPNQPLYQLAIKQLPVAPPCLWARRSMFSLNAANQPILVTEVFLPSLLARPK